MQMNAALRLLELGMQKEAKCVKKWFVWARRT